MSRYKLSNASVACIVTELLNAKNAIEYAAGDDGYDLMTTEPSDENSVEEWRDICKALKELGR